MKNKRLLLVLIIAAFMVFALGSGSSDGAENSSNVTSSSDTSDNKKPAKEVKESPTFDEQVIFEHDGVVVTAKEIIEDSFWGPQLKILIENNSDKDVTVTTDAMAVNGFMVNDLLYETVTAGQKSNAKINLLSSDLENAGIKNIGVMDLWFRMFDPSTYSTIFESKEPSTLQTSLYEKMDETVEIEGIEVVNEKGIRMVVQFVDNNSFWGTSVLIYAENNNSFDVNIMADNTSVNGYMINGYYYSDVKGGYKSFDTMTIFENELKDNDIDTIENIRMNFKGYDLNSFSTVFESDSITIDVTN